MFAARVRVDAVKLVLQQVIVLRLEELRSEILNGYKVSEGAGSEEYPWKDYRHASVEISEEVGTEREEWREVKCWKTIGWRRLLIELKW